MGLSNRRKALIYQMAGGAAGGIVMFLLGGKVTLSDVGFPFLNFLRFGEFTLGGAAGMVVAFAVSLALGLVFGFSTVEEN